MRGRIATLLAVLLVTVAALGAQDKPTQAPAKEAPALTEVQKLGIVSLAKDIQIAQLQAQAAQVAFEKAQGELQRLIASLQVPGYDLDLQTMTYKPRPQDQPGGGRQ